MLKRIIAITILIAALAIPMAVRAQTETARSATATPTSAPANKLFYLTYALNLTRADETQQLSYNDIYAAWESLGLSKGAGGEIVSSQLSENLQGQGGGRRGRGGPGALISGGMGIIIGVLSKDNVAQDRIDAIGRDLQQKLKSNINSTLPREQRIERIKQIDLKLDETSQKLTAFGKLEAQSTDLLLREKLSTLRQDSMRIESEKAAKDARRMALERQLKIEKNNVSKDADNDAIAAELRKLVDQREQEIKHVQDLYKSGVTGITEVQKSEAALSEAKIRLLERQAAMTKSSKGELLDRLADELAMVSVDVTDLDIQLARVREQLKQYDPATMDSKALDNLLAREPELGKNGNTAGTVGGEIISQQQDLHRQRFGLLVSDLSVTFVEQHEMVQR